MNKLLSGDTAHNGGRRGQLLHILADCEVSRVLLQNDNGGASKPRAVGIRGIQRIYETKGFNRILLSEKTITVRAKIVVCSAGALHTPAVLLRSGLQNKKIGRHLALHPVLGCAGLPPASAGTTSLNRGVGMGVVVGRGEGEQVVLGLEATRQKEDRSFHGVVIQTPPAHPGLMGLALPWRSGLSSKLCSLLFNHLALFIGISRDRSSAENRVTLDADGQSVINYQVTLADTPMLLAGLAAQIRLMFAAGCTVIFPLHETVSWFVRDESQTPTQQRQALDTYIEKVVALGRGGFEPLKMLCFSAHQMGSCRMASTPEEGPVSPTGELWEAENLYVADASVFPTSLGVNPMITVESFAIVISKSVISKLADLGVEPAKQDYEMDW